MSLSLVRGSTRLQMAIAPLILCARSGRFDSAVQASIAANTYVVSGHAENKKLQDLLPGIINQLGPDNLANLKKLAETYQAGGAPPPTATADDDEDVPDLVDNFEEASK